MNKTAVLIIHGLAGTPYSHQELALYLSNDFDVYSFFLPGHDGKIFNSPKKEDWINASCNMVDKLLDEGYNEIYLIGHSMGGVIASFVASIYPCITKLVLEAPAFIYNKKQNLNALKYYNPKFIIHSVTKLSLSAYKEFVDLVREYKDCVKNIDTKTLIIQGNDDILVPVRSSVYAYNNLRSKEKYLIIVDGMPHAIFRSKQKDNVNFTIKHFFKDKNFNKDKYEKLLNEKSNFPI